MYYKYRQNNSGGFWLGPADGAIIEAFSPEEADELAIQFGLYFDTDCECCGSRWSYASGLTEMSERPVISEQFGFMEYDPKKTILLVAKRDGILCSAVRTVREWAIEKDL